MTTLNAPSTPACPSRTYRGPHSRFRRELSVLLAYLAVLALLAITHPAFYHAQFRATWVSAAPALVAAVGMTLVILAREIDISIGSQFSVCGIIAGALAARGLAVPLVLLGTIAAGALMGAANGALVSAMKLPSIVVTLATMVVLRGGLLWATEGAAVHLPDGFQWFGQSQHAGQTLIVFSAIAVLAVFAAGLRWLAMGRAVYAVGSDREAARLAGIRPKRVIFAVFTLMGALTGLASLLSTAQFPLVYPNAGEGLELQVIAAVVVGGVAITGGRGTLFGTLLGVALLGTLSSALVFLHVQPQWAKAIQGLIILIAVASDGWNGLRRPIPAR
jgi:rhamnose transport system permease protein